MILIRTAEKIEQAENQLSHSRFGSLLAAPQRKKEVHKLFSLHFASFTIGSGVCCFLHYRLAFLHYTINLFSVSTFLGHILAIIHLMVVVALLLDPQILACQFH